MHLTFFPSLKFSLRFHSPGKLIMSLIRNFLGYSGKTSLLLILEDNFNSLVHFDWEDLAMSVELNSSDNFTLGVRPSHKLAERKPRLNLYHSLAQISEWLPVSVFFSVKWNQNSNLWVTLKIKMRQFIHMAMPTPVLVHGHSKILIFLLVTHLL